MDGPVRSTSRTPTRADGDEALRDNASWTDTEDLPTPPLPEQTMMICLTCCNRRATGVSAAEAMEDVVQLQVMHDVDEDDKPVGVDLFVLLTMAQSGCK